MPSIDALSTSTTSSASCGQSTCHNVEAPQRHVTAVVVEDDDADVLPAAAITPAARSATDGASMVMRTGKSTDPKLRLESRTSKR